LILVVWRSLTGHGDPLSVTYGQSAGVIPQLDASYAFPLTARDTMVMVRYRKNDFDVVETPFDDLDIRSESEIYGITLRHPLLRTLRRELAFSLAGEHLRNQTFLLGIPFSFSEGAHRGKSVVSVLRFALEWTERWQDQVIATRSQFSVGVDVLGATNNRSGVADSQFFSWLGQFQWVRRWGIREIQTIARVDVQLTDNPLLALEQIAIGGRYSVRGYRENQLVRDNGLIGSLEARVPLLRQVTSWATTLELAPFVDIGRAWNARGLGAHPEAIASVGIGLRWAMTVHSRLFPASPLAFTPQFEVYWGHPLHDVRTSGGNIQDAGVHVQLLVSVF
jgi:hemolysin activation/secretion protein